MRRWHLVEIHDLEWCPKVLREGLTDFLEVMIGERDIYGAIRPILLESLATSGAGNVVDLCSGAGGPWASWRRKGLNDAKITLTDKFPNQAACQRLRDDPLPGLRYWPESVDATSVPPALEGFRTVFTAFHHFPPESAARIIRTAIDENQPIAICEYTCRHLAAILFMLLSPLAVWGLTPRMRTRGWLKLLLTYALPLIPLIVTLDGVVSCLRTYTLAELKSLAGDSNYTWMGGTCKGRQWPLPITYFIGHPKR